MVWTLFSASKIRAAVLLEQNNLPAARESMVIACGHWRKYADIMDELYIGADMQRNHSFKSWHQLDADVLRDLANIGGLLAVDDSKPHPWVRIVSPSDQSELMGPLDVTVEVNAGAGDNKEARVELRSNGKRIEAAAEGSRTFTIKDMHHVNQLFEQDEVARDGPDTRTNQDAVELPSLDLGGDDRLRSLTKVGETMVRVEAASLQPFLGGGESRQHLFGGHPRKCGEVG